MLVIRLQKLLCDLKKSSHGWYKEFKNFIISIGFEPLRIDGGLFILGDKSKVIASVIMYVNNLLIFSKDIGDIKKQWATRFQMHDM